MRKASNPIFYDAPRAGMPVDVGIYFEPSFEEVEAQLIAVEARLIASEADRAARLVRIQEIWKERDEWIAKYEALNSRCCRLESEHAACMNNLTLERDRLIERCQADLVANHGLSRDLSKARSDANQAWEALDQVTRERDGLAVEMNRLTAERDVASAAALTARRKIQTLKRFSPWWMVPAPLKRTIGRILRV